MSYGLYGAGGGAGAGAGGHGHSLKDLCDKFKQAAKDVNWSLIIERERADSKERYKAIGEAVYSALQKLLTADNLPAIHKQLEDIQGTLTCLDAFQKKHGIRLRVEGRRDDILSILNILLTKVGDFKLADESMANGSRVHITNLKTLLNSAADPKVDQKWWAESILLRLQEEVRPALNAQLGDNGAIGEETDFRALVRSASELKSTLLPLYVEWFLYCHEYRPEVVFKPDSGSSRETEIVEIERTIFGLLGNYELDAGDVSISAREGNLEAYKKKMMTHIELSGVEKTSLAAGVCCTPPIFAANAIIFSSFCMAKCAGAKNPIRLACCFALSGTGWDPTETNPCASGSAARNCCDVATAFFSQEAELQEINDKLEEVRHATSPTQQQVMV